jgi:CelD/BcsL family acetyltransferase involved in cellulose biosynthesis
VLPGPDGLLARLSANTRQQMRRSDRAYAALGAPDIREAASLDEALAFLDAMAVLHQAAWRARGQPGAFANPAFVRFHRALVARALPRGEMVLLRVGFGARLAGYLYNFRHRGTVSAYQSGFDFAGAPPHGKPGLTSHHAAILRARDEGAVLYDFLAGADRYKTSLASFARTLCWLDAADRRSVAGLAITLRNVLTRRGVKPF